MSLLSMSTGASARTDLSNRIHHRTWKPEALLGNEPVRVFKNFESSKVDARQPHTTWDLLSPCIVPDLDRFSLVQRNYIIERHMTYAEAKAVADIMAQALANPREPSSCPLCPGLLSLRLCHGNLAEHFPQLRVDCHALFDACIATLVLHRTPDEITQLQRKLMANRRRCSTHAGMELPLPPPVPPLELISFLECACSIFGMAVQLQAGERSFAERAGRANKSFADKQGRWPVRVEQLLPNGPRPAVDALLAYCELYISSNFIVALSSMLAIARPAIYPVLTSEPFHSRLVAVILTMLDPPASDTGARARWLLNYHRAFDATVNLLRTLFVGPGALPNDRAVLFVGHEPAVLRVLAPLIDRMPAGDPFALLFSHLFADLAQRYNFPLPPRVGLLVEQHTMEVRNKGPATLIHEYLKLAMAARVCSGPGCASSVLDNAGGKPFPACARCKVPRYCSRACQRADWRGEGAAPPHKGACRVLEMLDAQACPDLSFEQFREAYVRAEPLFDEADKEVIRLLTNRWSECYGTA